THTGQRSVGTVDTKGNYEIFGLRPSDYTVTVAGKTQTATLQVGQTVSVDFAAAATPGGAIVVTGSSNAQPVQAQTVATNITPAQIENIPQIAIQEYQLETQNFGAEVGQAASALLTAITKTGGDHFHGSAFLEFQPKSFITQPFFDKKNGIPKPEYQRYQLGGYFGGPII